MPPICNVGPESLQRCAEVHEAECKSDTLTRIRLQLLLLVASSLATTEDPYDFCGENGHSNYYTSVGAMKKGGSWSLAAW